ncbi:VWA domain-containing protein [Actinomadura sp. NEAU-AAG7]|uniref:VWA domain-containing protein n=1 Tax=Actinomadura sp. NEAU-AAG7 TaxID=2839640 RepID=UPI001BE4971D|nr:VWA domain-containing protein [Actinomadura sp. NEAU-AAG7]MBT2206568.1 VWA domain-containing protein [Actinomadura sp. NEAU-AAG7]
MPISLEKVNATAPGLVDLYKTARVNLEKRGLGGERAAVYLVLDRSGSMRRYYKDGTVQHLAEQALALAAHLDDDGKVPVVFFDKSAYPPVEVGLTRYQGRINEEHERLGHMGTTNYAAAMEAVIAHYQGTAPAAPAFVIFQTDGSPDSKTAAEKVLCGASTLPIFWHFIGFGNDEFRFLHKLDDLPVPQKRMIDNAAFFPAGPEPRAIADDDLYHQLMTEFPSWPADARAAGIVK